MSLMENPVTTLETVPLRLVKGSALAICLIFLLLVTILGMSVVKTTTLQDKMAANTRDKDLAFQAAEAALKVAETALAAGQFAPASFSDTCDNGLCTVLPGSATNMRWEDPALCGAGKTIWMCNKSRALSGDNALDSKIHAQQPRYFVEVLDEVTTADELNMVNIGDSVVGETITIYRITAIGYGGSANATTVLQSTYAR